MTVILGTSGSDNHNGGSGSDVINGGGGNDKIGGGSGCDLLDGGAGSDRVSGDAGNDLLVYVAAQNVGATDIYDGGSGTDGLALVLTRAEWLSVAVQNDIARYLKFLATETNPQNCQASNAEFRFTTFDLRASKLEALFVVVDGKMIDPRDGAVTLIADALTATEDAAGAAVDLLASDKIADFAKSVTHTQGAHGGVAVVLTLATPGQPQRAQAVYTPDAAHWQSLAAGQMGTDIFTYTITDADGDVATQTVTVTITGSNDGPVAVADAAAISQGQTLAVDVRANDTDVDAGAVLTVTSATAPMGKGTATILDGQVRFAAGTDFDHLAAGATEVVRIAYAITDEHGATSSSTIDVTITGTNDAPVITSNAAAAIGSVVEAGNADDGAILAGTPSATGALAASDIDDGATATWTGSGDGALGGFAITAAGAWGYTLDQTRAASLAEGDTRTETFTATVSDGLGGDATQLVTITVTGTNDAPVVTSTTAAASGSVVEAGIDADGAAFAGTSAATGMLTASDVDDGATLGWSGSAAGSYGSFAIDAAGSYIYTLDDVAAQALGVGETRTESFTATITDDKGASATQIVTITITGTNDAPTIAASTTASGAVTESTGENARDHTASGGIAFADFDTPDVHSATVTAQGLGYLGALTLGMLDQTSKVMAWSFAAPDDALGALAAGQQLTQTYNVTIADGKGGSVAQVVTITITGTNDAPVVSEAVSGIATEGGASSTLSALANASDIDAGDKLSVVLSADPLPAGVTFDAAAAAFTLDPAAYASLAAGEVRTVTASYLVSDGIASAPASVRWTVTGTNGAPTVTGAVTGTATEDGATSTLSALANAADADAGTKLSVVGLPAGLPASVTYDTAAASFALDPSAYQSLAAGQTITVTVEYGISDGTASTPASVVWTLTGTNDAPVVTGAVTGAAAEDGAKSSLHGLANASDVDAGAALAITGVPAKLPDGVTFDAATGTFTLDPAAYQSLAGGDSVVITVSYGVTDGTDITPASVSWTVTGGNDAPVVTASDDGTVTEDAASTSATGNIVFADPDGRGTASVAVAVKPEGYLGVFNAVIAENGRVAWTFDVDNAKLQYLAAGQTLTQNYEVTIADGQGGTVTDTVSVVMTGVNDEIVFVESISAQFTDNGNIRSGYSRHFFTDADTADVHTATIIPEAEGYVGTATVTLVMNGEGGKNYVDVNYSFPIDQIIALPNDRLDQEYDIRIFDNAGDTYDFGRVAHTEQVDYHIAGAETDSFSGSSKDRNVMVGNGGSDAIFGGKLHDEIYGDLGPSLPRSEKNEFSFEADEIGNPNVGYDDYLNGRGGADTLTGGAGKDIFSFWNGEANGDIVTDFNSAEGDYLLLSTYGEGATFNKLDATHWEVATADRSVVEVITFSNAPDITPANYLLW